MVQIMPASTIAKFIVTQGLTYMVSAIFFIAYHQILDIFDDSLTDSDYKIVQFGFTIVFLLGAVFVDGGMPHFINRCYPR